MYRHKKRKDFSSSIDGVAFCHFPPNRSPLKIVVAFLLLAFGQTPPTKVTRWKDCKIHLRTMA